MPNTEEKWESLVFTNKTTYLNSYQPPEIRPVVKTTYRVKRTRPRPDYVTKNLDTLTPYKNPNIPFDLFHMPDPIIQRDPRKMQEPHEKIQDEDRAKVQKSRPKVVGKGPACDLDALEEPGRQIIIDDIYSTTTSRAQRDAVVAGANLQYVRAPLPNAYSKCRPVFVEPLTEPFVSPEWRMDTVMWDGKQHRAHTDPTKNFWLMGEKSFCSVCEDTTMRTKMNKYKTRN